MNMLYLSGPYLPLAIKTGIVSGILALTVSRFYPLQVIGQRNCKEVVRDQRFHGLTGRDCSRKDICCFEELPS